MQSFNRTPALAICIVAAVFLAGCQEEQTVKTYTVARTTPPRSPFPLEQVDQILVAIVPQDDKAWFFKLVGKKPAIERQKQAFEDFLATVELASTPAASPTWTLPTGWTEKGPSEMRDATLVVPDEDGALELAVSSLPLTVDWEDFLVPNVNRWLGQLQCDRLPKETILNLAEQMPTTQASATVFHLAGLKPAQAMKGNPHAGLGIDPPPSMGAQPATRPKAELTYEKPEAWLPGKMSMMRKAAFLLPGGGPSDEVTVTSFPAGGGQMSDVAANVQRWASQVGMQVPSSESLGELTSKISIGGLDGTYVELASPEDAARPAALFVAMLEREGQVWFFKMIGGKELVTSQREEFRNFLASVSFD